MKNTLEIVSGPQKNVSALCFYNNEKNYDQKIHQHFELLRHDEQLIVCTDIQYGSVNQLFVKEALRYADRNICILSGINLPLLLEIVTTPGMISREVLHSMVKKAAEQIVHIDFGLILDTDREDDIFNDF